MTIHLGVPSVSPSFALDLFQQTAYWQANTPPTWVFDYEHPVTGSIQARFPVWCEGTQALSPHKATFGGIAFAPDLEMPVLQEFVEEIIQFLQNQGVKSLQVNCFAACYDAHAEAYFQLFTSLGFILLYEEYNQHLDLRKDFRQGLHPSARRRLAKCKRAGMYAQPLQGVLHPNVVYEFILAARQRKGYPMSISATSFAELFDKIPDAYMQWGVFDQQTLVATCTVVLVRKSQIAYYFLPADHPNYQAYSPSIFLIDAIVQYLQPLGFHLFDLGISSYRGVLNVGLARFKKNVGAIFSPKPCFVYGNNVG